MKKQIKLNETKLKELIETTVKNILKEDSRFIGNHQFNDGKKVYEFDVEVVYHGKVKAQGKNENDAKMSIEGMLPSTIGDEYDVNLELDLVDII